MDDLKYAKQIFNHYFETAFNHAEVIWTSDNRAEIERAVEAIYTAAKESAVKEMNDGNGKTN